MMMMILGVVISVYVIAEIFHIITTITTCTLVNCMEAISNHTKHIRTNNNFSPTLFTECTKIKYCEILMWM